MLADFRSTPVSGHSNSNVRFSLFYVRFTPETYRYISKVRQASYDPKQTFGKSVS